MARKGAVKRPFEDALLRRYRYDLEQIRRNYIEAADNLGLDDIAKELRKQARASESDYRILQRKFRSDVAKARKLGLVGKKVSARSANPTASLSKSLNEVWEALSGRRKAVKVTPEAARKMKAEGFRVKGNRVLVEPKTKINRKTGEVTANARFSSVRKRIDLRKDVLNVEKQVEDLWSGLKDGEWVTYTIYGNYASVLYAPNKIGMDDFLRDMLRYTERQDDKVDYAYIVRDDYPKLVRITDEAQERKFRQRDENERNKRKRRRGKRKGIRGLRKQRGH